MAGSSVLRRPTQKMRRDTMRARLLDATLEVILEEGWAQTSTNKICDRAGVSRGAQTHHYPSKLDLLMASVKQIVLRYQDEIDGRVGKIADGDAALLELFDLLWDACLENGLMESWIEAMIAARTDASLRDPVAHLDEASLEAMRKMGEKMPADDRLSCLSADLVELTVYLLRGMVVQRGVHGDEANRRRLFDLWRDMTKLKIAAEKL